MLPSNDALTSDGCVATGVLHPIPFKTSPSLRGIISKMPVVLGL